jgi:lambda family phage tail tape measure protein
MSYANLNIIINTNAAQAAQSMSGFGNDAKQALNGAQSDVEKFRQTMADTAAANEAAAHRFQSSMEAANDAVIGKTQETKKAMEDVAKATDNINPKGFAEKVSAAFGAAFGAGYAATDTWLQKTEDLVVAKGKAIAIGVAIAAVSAVAATMYAAYQIVSTTYNFIEGLFTGDSMKSKSIDALMAINAQVKSLQAQLNISAVEAMALQDAMGRLGVDKSGYVETYTQAATAMRTNTEELDRLGVKYKDNNGQLLTQAQFLTNVKAKLDEYRDGFDRSAAAAAIGAGSYSKVVDALKLTEAQIQQSKSRIDDYNLGIGPETQAAVARYQQAMRDFDSESRKTSEGFSRVISDSFMPMATAMAEWLKNGFPSALAVFRGVVATAATLVYGFATSVGMAFEAIMGSAESMGYVLIGSVVAAKAALSGDFSGAKVAMADALDAAKERMAKTGQAMVDIAVANNKNIKAAWAADERNQPLDQARDAATKQGAGKDWKPADKPEKDISNDPNRAPFARYMEELDRMNIKLDQNEYAMMRVKAAQEAVRQKGLDLASAMDQANAAIDRIQRTESQRAVDVFTNKLKLENDAYAQQSELIGLSVTQQELAAVAIKRRMEAENAINEAKKAGKPLDDQAIADLRTNTEEQIKNMQALVAARQAMQRTGEFGQNKAFQEYADAASNQALQVKSAWGNAFRGMEDAMVAFVKTGKLDFKSMADSIISDLIRIMVQRSITGPLANSIGSMFGSGASTDYSLSSGQNTGGLGLKGGSADSLYSSTPSYAVGTPYVPRDMLALVHEGEAITPKGANTGINVQIINNTQSQVTAQSDGQGGLMVLVDMVKNAMASDVLNGVGSMPRAMEARYGLHTAGA